jgi:D-xylose transport system substrate-binding protein
MQKLLVTIMAFFAAGQLLAAPATEKIKIGFVLSTLQEERYLKDEKYFVEEAKRLGFEPIVVSADNNAQTQTAKVENLLSKGVKALVIQPVNSNSAANLVKMAHEDKVPVVAYDRLIADAPVDFYVTMNSYQVGVLQAEAAVKATGGKGNFVILMGQSGHSVANEITRGNLDVLKKSPNIKVVVQKNHDQWSPSLALATTENALTQYKNEVAAVLANNSGMANAAVQALAEQKLAGKVFVAGADADLAAVKNIVAGRQQLDILKDIAPLAKTSAQVAFQLAKNEKPKSDSTAKSGAFDIPTVNTPVYAIDKNNLEERIFKTGFHKKTDVYPGR